MGTKGGRKASAVLVSFLLLSIPAARAVPAVLAPRADQTIADLQSTDADRRSKAVQALKDAGDPEAAAPLAPLVGDPEDAIQLDAIAAELNIFLTEKIVTRRRVGFVIEHNLDVIKTADYIIDLGPEGGEDGGAVVATGTPEQLAQIDGSHTGRYLRPVLAEGRSHAYAAGR